MKVLIAGDYCPRGRVEERIRKNDFESILSDVKQVTSNADYSIVNLECPVVENKAQPIDKCGPNLRCSSKGLTALRWAGFNCVTLANNHYLDFGETGVNDTLRACKEKGIDTVGGGVNAAEAAKILYKEINGSCLAIINCCEHEFSIASENGAGSNPLNVVKQYYAIKEAKAQADYVMLIVHGGVELFWLPSTRMIETYRFFIDAGADAVVNHHQHCYSGYEIYNGKPIFYGLGNFCFDGIGSGERWVSGFMVVLDLTDKNVKYELMPYWQCDEQVGVHLMQDEDKDSFFMQLETYNEIIADNIRRECEYLKWCEDNKEMFKSALNPVYNRFTKKIFDGSFGLKLIRKAKWLKTKNYIENESHIERMRLLINDYLNKFK